MEKRFTFARLLEEYPTEAACFEKITNLRFPDGIFCKNCQRITLHYALKKRKAYLCDLCLHQVYPLKGTIFEKSVTPLRYWFYAIFVISKTRAGVSAKTLERELGVTYKTAWRMFKQIRTLMAEDSGELLTGIVEVDETFVGGRYRHKKNTYGNWEMAKPKEVLMGMVVRGGPVRIKHIPNTGKFTMLKEIQDNISTDATIYTDDFPSYRNLHQYGYVHESVNHSKREYVKGDVYTQNIENVWSHLKRGIRGVYRVVSSKYLITYANEFAFRYNHRHEPEKMFEILLSKSVLN